MAQTLPELLNVVRDAMLQNQDCSACKGPCQPDSHIFEQQQYETPSATVEFSQTLASLLATGQDSQQLGQLGEGFLRGGNPTDFDTPANTDAARRRLLDAAAARLGLPPTQTSQVVQEPVAGGSNVQPGQQQQESLVPGGQQQRQEVPVPAGQQQQAGQQQGELLAILKRQQEQHEMLLRILQTQAMSSTSAVESGQSSTTAGLTTGTQGRVGIAPVVNPRNASYLGANPPPLLHVEGDIQSLDMSKVKNKLRSGKNWTGETTVYKQVGWPQQFLNRLYVSPVAHDKLSPEMYFSGSLNKILADLDPALAGSRAENQLLFLANLATQSLISPWSDVLMLSSSFYESMEQNVISWDSWPAIQRWWDRSLDSLKCKTAADKANPPKKPRLDNQSGQPASQPPGQQKTHLAGLSISWMGSNQICIKFQTGNCDKTGDHKTVHGNDTLKHICGGCLKLGKPDDSSHSAKLCPFKDQFFHQGV